MELRNDTPDRTPSPLSQELAALLGEGQQQIQIERKRLLKLRQRLKSRWHKHWAAQREAVRRNEARLAAQRSELEAERERHRQNVVEFLQEQRRFKTEAELIRGHLRAERKLLCRRRDELDAQEQQLKSRVSAVGATNGCLPRADEPSQAVEASQARVTQLQDLAGALADQRLVLAEQLQRFALARQRWDESREQTVAELEALARQIQTQEQALRNREQALAQKEVVTMEAHEAKLKQMVEASRLQREGYEKEVRTLREELERLTKALLREKEKRTRPGHKAA
jgi:hypothetical protein